MRKPHIVALLFAAILKPRASIHRMHPRDRRLGRSLSTRNRTRNSRQHGKQ
jgi:hypothetical protein